MSDDYESDESELFEVGEMIVLTLKDGRHYLGEYVGFYDTGVAIKVEAKTSLRIIKKADDKFKKFVKTRVDEELRVLYSPSDWVKKFNELNEINTSYDISSDMSLEQIKEHVTNQIFTIMYNKIKSTWNVPILDQDVTEPYLKELKRSVRMLVMWDKIDEVCSAVELAEEAEIADLTNLMDSEDFFRLIEGK